MDFILVYVNFVSKELVLKTRRLCTLNECLFYFLNHKVALTRSSCGLADMGISKTVRILAEHAGMLGPTGSGCGHGQFSSHCLSIGLRSDFRFLIF